MLVHNGKTEPRDERKQKGGCAAMSTKSSTPTIESAPEEMARENRNDVGKRAQPPWQLPVNSMTERMLMLYNSLTRKKEPFVPNEGKRVKWYICGPTVYDSAHMGHARAYLSFDILRRVLIDYFGYDVQYIMNITDIDDKVIKRARQRHLLDDYLAKHADSITAKKVIEDVLEALTHFQAKINAETDPDKKKMYEVMILKVNEASRRLEAAFVKSNQKEVEEAKTTLLTEAKDILSDWLDSLKGHTVNDHRVFDALAKKYEDEFLEDMTRLHVMPPDVLTRVSEYVPEVIAYVQRIIDNGYGYITKDGSVYFDTVKFDQDPRHSYAKLVPEAFGDAEQLLKNMRESEGELSMSSDKLLEKRNPTDFALWKSSKSGEPFWDSPWGKGRPGWHIECSAMSSEICREKLDIHSGGFDLKFPHHDNEIAQVEAHYDCSNWVNYFLHCGTLRIAGMKMSKSLKNFITIRAALKDYTARQLRILFLMHNWTDVLDYSASTMERALQFEKMTNDFFLLVKDYLRRYYTPEKNQGYQKYGHRELVLMDQFFARKASIDAALRDSVDTRTALEKVRELIGLGNAYIVEREREGQIPNCLLLRNIAAYITWLLKIFGAIPQHVEVGFPIGESDSFGGSISSSSSMTFNKEEVVMPFLTTLADFREAVRKIAKEHQIAAILEECDRLRDEVLPELGVRLEDRGAQTCVKLVDKETLKREQEQKKAVEAAKEAEKQRKLREQQEKAAAKEAAKRIPPQDLFRQGEEAAKYSKWDERGIPTHTADGEEISKKQRKKFEKAFEAQQKLYESALNENGN